MSFFCAQADYSLWAVVTRHDVASVRYIYIQRAYDFLKGHEKGGGGGGEEGENKKGQGSQPRGPLISLSLSPSWRLKAFHHGEYYYFTGVGMDGDNIYLPPPIIMINPLDGYKETSRHRYQIATREAEAGVFALQVVFLGRHILGQRIRHLLWRYCTWQFYIYLPDMAGR